MGMVDEDCLPNNAYYTRSPVYILYSGVIVCWSEHSNSSFVYGYMSLDYGLGTMTAITTKHTRTGMRVTHRLHEGSGRVRTCLKTFLRPILNDQYWC